MPCVTLNLSTSLLTDRSKYSSSSTVPFLPEPTFLSIFRFDLDVRLRRAEERYINSSVPLSTAQTHRDDRDALVGATVYRVNAVGAIDTSVMTSTFCNAGLSSTP